jgi:methylated-DNA-[protein]-cysteine S-methyltransferase
VDAGTAPADPDLAEPVKAVAAYYTGDLHAVGRVPVRQRSGAYRELAWDVLRQVAPGEHVTYTEYAQRTGRPAAVRAAAGACAMNAAALFVPCHRVLRSDGTLGGFRYGLAIKERLLAREAAV